MAVVTLLTDFGVRDYYVAAVKGVLLATAGVPLTLVDLGHEIDPGDIEGAAFLLAAAAPLYPPDTVHLAVVDPGVGSARRILVAAADGQRFVAPDNGLLTPFLDRADAVVAVARRDLYRDVPGHTFHGRDRFAPVAAALAAGTAPAELGEPISDPVRLQVAPPRREATALHGRVVHVDRYGNLVTDLPAAWATSLSPAEPYAIRVDGRERRVRPVTTYVDLASGEAGILVGSLATLELSLDGDSLAARWGVKRGAAVEIPRLQPSTE